MAPKPLVPEFGAPPPGYVAGRGRGAVGLSAPDFGTPPPGYVAGRGRGAAPLDTHREKPRSVASMDVEMADGPHVFGKNSDVRVGETVQNTTAADSRARRLHMRAGGRFTKDAVREDQGCDFDAPDRTAESDLGYKIEPFNMRREKSEGHFDEDGMYIEHKEDRKHLRDAWLDTVDEGLATAKIAPEHVKNLSAEQKKLMDSKLVYERIAPGDESDDGIDTDQPASRIDWRPLVYELCHYLTPLETPNQAMRRLKKGLAADGKFVLRKKKTVASAPPRTAATPSASTVPSRPKKRLSEWGYDDQPVPKRLNEEHPSDANTTEKSHDGVESSTNDVSVANGTVVPASPKEDIGAEQGNAAVSENAAEGTVPTDDDDFVSGLLKLDVPPAEIAAGEPAAVEGVSTAKSPLERLTELCDLLLQHEMYDIYTTTRESLSAKFMLTQQQYVVAGDGPFWQYQFEAADQWYGPFDSATMQLWHGHLSGKKVRVRSVSAAGEPLDDISREFETIDFALYM